MQQNLSNETDFKENVTRQRISLVQKEIFKIDAEILEDEEIEDFHQEDIPSTEID